MKFEVVIPQDVITKAVNVAVNDYVRDNATLRNMVRNSIYELVALQAHKILKESPEKLVGLVMSELQAVLEER